MLSEVECFLDQSWFHPGHQSFTPQLRFYVIQTGTRCVVGKHRDGADCAVNRKEMPRCRISGSVIMVRAIRAVRSSVVNVKSVSIFPVPSSLKGR